MLFTVSVHYSCTQRALQPEVYVFGRNDVNWRSVRRRYTKNPRMDVQRMENLEIAFGFLQKEEKMSLFGIGELGNNLLQLSYTFDICFAQSCALLSILAGHHNPSLLHNDP